MNDEQGIAVKNTRNLPYLDLSTLEYTKWLYGQAFGLHMIKCLNRKHNIWLHYQF